MEFSLPAWLGALAGTIVAVAVYLPAIRVVERRLRRQSGPKTLEQAHRLRGQTVDRAPGDLGHRHRPFGDAGLLDRQLLRRHWRMT